MMISLADGLHSLPSEAGLVVSLSFLRISENGLEIGMAETRERVLKTQYITGIYYYGNGMFL